METNHFSRLANHLITAVEKTEAPGHHKKIVVNLLVSKFASWYEKIRNAMDYREEEAILRSAIERILRRRILLGGDGKKIAEPLIRELVWAHYFPDDSLSEEIIEKVEKKIDLYLYLRKEIVRQHRFSELTAEQWMYHLLSADIEYLLHPMKEEDLLSNFMYQVMRNTVTITDDTEQTKDVQVFIAVRKAFAKDDIAFLRYHLFTQFFGSVSKQSIEKIIADFMLGYKEIQLQLQYPRKDRIYSYVNSRTAAFLVLEDLLQIHKGKIRELYQDEDSFTKAVFAICEARYSKISSKVQRAIVRSVIFILLTKTFFAFAVEGTFESIIYGKVFWNSILLNTGIPPLFMVIAYFFLRPPGEDNSKRILVYIKTILTDEDPVLGNQLVVRKNPDKKPVLNMIFTLLWFLTFLLAFGGIIFLLTKLNFLFISQAVFLFFMAIVSFLTYRISLMAKEYSVEEKQGWTTPIFDFFFMPFIRVGRHLTEGISQVNILLFVLDFVIETPFKGIFGFFEQWFFFLHAKREEL